MISLFIESINKEPECGDYSLIINLEKIPWNEYYHFGKKYIHVAGEAVL